MASLEIVWEVLKTGQELVKELVNCKRPESYVQDLVSACVMCIYTSLSKLSFCRFDIEPRT